MIDVTVRFSVQSHTDEASGSPVMSDDTLRYALFSSLFRAFEGSSGGLLVTMTTREGEWLGGAERASSTFVVSDPQETPA